MCSPGVFALDVGFDLQCLPDFLDTLIMKVKNNVINWLILGFAPTFVLEFCPAPMNCDFGVLFITKDLTDEMNVIV
jgi:hypothetical protein